MHAKIFVVSVVIAGAIIPASGKAASAQPMNDSQNEAQTKKSIQKTSKSPLLGLLGGSDYSALTAEDWLIQDTPDKPKAKTKQEPIIHTVRNGETLSSIAKQHDTKWLRLWQKNMDLEDPDELTAGDKLTIPRGSEKLEKRELPVPVIEPQPVPQTSKPARQQPQRPQQRQQPESATSRESQTSRIAAGSSAGNRYTPGYCTWYVKNKRPDLPNSLGNADTWVSRAAAQGLATGSTPRAGAVGQRGMHVVYVERVNPDGTIFISEMNRKGLWITSSRTVPANYFTYVY